MVKIHRIASSNVNCYIVADNDKAILIDTGRKKYCEKNLERCKKDQHTLKEKIEKEEI